MRPDCPRPSPPSEVRLQKYLAACGLGSRRRCEELIRAGVVSVDGRVVSELGARVPEAGANVAVRGVPVSPRQTVSLLLHKPPGVLCTNLDPRGRPTFLDLLPPLTGRVFSVGRLDGASEGLLLVTNDGDLAHRLMHPRHHVPKVYRVWPTQRIKTGDRAAFRAGIEVDGIRMRMASIRPVSAGREVPCYEVVLHEGRNRQIRCMLGARGIGVRRLVRIAFGPLCLGRLAPGASRPLSEEERKALDEMDRT